jgi:hypothetical protein
MVRKQFYLEPEQDRKLKMIASRRGCTEAEVVREALARLPGVEDDALAQLEADGLLAPSEVDPDLPQGDAARAFLEAYQRWLDRHPRSTRLSEAILEDRGPR